MRCLLFLFFLLCLAGPAGAERIVLSAVGDINLVRVDPVKDAGFLDAVGPVLRKSDIVLGNLECCLSRRGVPAEKQFVFRADPALAPVLRKAGFTHLTLANNHALDYGCDAFKDTVAALSVAGIVPVGVADHDHPRGMLTVTEKNGIKVGLLGFCGLAPYSGAPGPGRPAAAHCDPDRMCALVREAKASVDVLVVTVHWGRELAAAPLRRHRQLAYRLIDSGANLVLGHHPHVLQGMEKYRTGYVFYSLGNFVFNSRSRCARRTMILRCVIDRQGVRRILAVPVVIKEGRPAPDAEYDIKADMDRLSALLLDSQGHSATQ